MVVPSVETAVSSVVMDSWIAAWIVDKAAKFSAVNVGTVALTMVVEKVAIL